MNSSDIRISFLGDFMPGGLIDKQIDVYSHELKQFLSKSHIRVATLECAIGENMEFDPVKMARADWRNIIYAPNHAINKLKAININLVSLANNHIYDLGEEGLINTINLLNKLDIKYVGAGINKEEASKPAVINIKGKSIAFLAYMEPHWRAPHGAEEDKAGINLFQIDKAINDIKMCKKLYDYVFILPHWGVEYTHFPLPSDVKKVNKLIEAGADGIFGSHTHMIQPYTNIGNSVVYYSLGNFLFPDFYMSKERPIYYPMEGENTSEFPISYEYPKNPKSTTLRVWKRSSRIGLVANIEIHHNKCVTHNPTYIFTNASNHVELLQRDNIIKLKLSIIRFFTKCHIYAYIHKFKSLIVKIKKTCSSLKK